MVRVRRLRLNVIDRNDCQQASLLQPCNDPTFGILKAKILAFQFIQDTVERLLGKDTENSGQWRARLTGVLPILPGTPSASCLESDVASSYRVAKLVSKEISRFWLKKVNQQCGDILALQVYHRIADLSSHHHFAVKGSA